MKKKVPWKGKSIMVLIPRDDERGQPGKAPNPLDKATVEGMFREWEQLGYDTRGFDLDTPKGFAQPGEYSQSRGAWPDPEDLRREVQQRAFKVLLPDLNGKLHNVDYPAGHFSCHAN